MKLFSLQNSFSTRRPNSFRGLGLGFDSSSLDSNSSKTPSTLSWVLIHCLCCLISLALGFRFSRLLFFLLFSTSSSSTTSSYSSPPLLRRTATAETLTLHNLPSFPLLNPSNRNSSRVVVGRHGILIRPWPHPNPTEVMKAHRIIDRVQREQRIQSRYGIKNPKTLIVVTPTYVRTFQALHLTGLVHSLMLVPYDVIWIVVEAGGTTDETAAVLAKSGLRTIHIAFEQQMPNEWEDRHRMEARMRLRALRAVREGRLDGIVMFADDSNMHSMELFDEIQSVEWIGAVSIGILAHSGNSEELSSMSKEEEDGESLPMPVQGPSCNSSGHLVGWHTFDSVPFVEKSARYTDDRAVVLPRKLEWAGFVMNSRLVWMESEDKPDWVRDLDTLAEDGVMLDSPLSLLKDASFVEPLGDCGRTIMLWWLRVEARADSKFPSRWRIDPPLEITIPAKRTPWPDALPETLSGEKVNGIQGRADKQPPKTVRTSRSRHGSRNKRKHESKPAVDTQGSGMNVEAS